MHGNNYRFNESVFNDDPVIRTFTGKYVNPFDFKIEDVDIEDIAHALSMLCRFGGHCKQFFSVAQHSLHVCQCIENFDLKLTGLLHDASEAYLVDVPRPIKKYLTNYKDIENRIQAVISEKFNLVYPFPEEIHLSDEQQLVFEWENIMISDWDDCNGMCMDPYVAKKWFLKMYNSLV